MKSASKSTLSLNNLNILKPKVTKNLTNLHKKLCESPTKSLRDEDSPCFGFLGIYAEDATIFKSK